MAPTSVPNKRKITVFALLCLGVPKIYLVAVASNPSSEGPFRSTPLPQGNYLFVAIHTPIVLDIRRSGSADFRFEWSSY